MGRIGFKWSITSDNPMTAEDLRCADSILARLIAAAYAADHPELFRTKSAGEPIMGDIECETGGTSISGGAHAEIH